MKLQPFESGKRKAPWKYPGRKFSDAQANGQGKPAKVGKCRAFRATAFPGMTEIF
jgi:hypothetical protein